jgi:hypothetical protein
MALSTTIVANAAQVAAEETALRRVLPYFANATMEANHKHWTLAPAQASIKKLLTLGVPLASLLAILPSETLKTYARANAPAATTTTTTTTTPATSTQTGGGFFDGVMDFWSGIPTVGKIGIGLGAAYFLFVGYDSGPKRRR